MLERFFRALAVFWLDSCWTLSRKREPEVDSRDLWVVWLLVRRAWLRYKSQPEVNHTSLVSARALASLMPSSPPLLRVLCAGFILHLSGDASARGAAEHAGR